MISLDDGLLSGYNIYNKKKLHFTDFKNICSDNLSVKPKLNNKSIR